jgi:hypothetical protein
MGLCGHASSDPSTIRAQVASPHSEETVPTPSKTSSASGVEQAGQIRCVTHGPGDSADQVLCSEVVAN